MDTLVALRRAMCPRCLRAQSTCICAWIVPLATAVEVVILQHRLEVNNAKGSARLLHLGLQNSRMLTGEVFSATQWLPPDDDKCTVLLYPASPAGAGLVAPPTLQPQALTDLTQLRVIVLDGTWRKSRKMLYLNPALQNLPRLGLQTTPPSQYRIRKAQRDDQLSTLEATCHALLQLGEPALGLQRLLDGFDGFVAQHAATQIDRSERARPGGSG